MSIQDIEKALKSIRRAPNDEKELQGWMASAFVRAGIPFEREVETGDGPVDFVIGDIAVEVKIKGSPVQIARQLIRYLRAPRFSEIVLVTTRAVTLPAEIDTEHGKKSLTVVALWRQFL